MKPRCFLTISCVLALTSFAVVTASGQAPEVVLHSSSQIPQSVVLSVRPYSTSWVLLQSSSDLANWQPVVNLLTTNSSVPFVGYSAPNAFARFYRVRSPGVTTAEALSLWVAGRPTRFQYSFQNTKLDGGGVVLVGTVTISSGIKKVTNVTANGIPTSTFAPADFPTADDIFTVITDVESQGAKLAHVAYDGQWSFPATAVIIRSTAMPMTDYRISGFVDLSGGTGRRARPAGVNTEAALQRSIESQWPSVPQPIRGVSCERRCEGANSHLLFCARFGAS